MRTLKLIGKILLGIVLVLALAAAVLYYFGGMERPSKEMSRAYYQMVASGATQPLPEAGFVVPIPGCRCHSDDPVQTMAHAGYRIRDCMSCHQR